MSKAVSGGATRSRYALLGYRLAVGVEWVAGLGLLVRGNEAGGSAEIAAGCGAIFWIWSGGLLAYSAVTAGSWIHDHRARRIGWVTVVACAAFLAESLAFGFGLLSADAISYRLRQVVGLADLLLLLAVIVGPLYLVIEGRSVRASGQR
ncbi:MAG: hypothetical protein U0X73_06215 [Thermoanaerobaculia bacterium]